MNAMHGLMEHLNSTIQTATSTSEKLCNMFPTWDMQHEGAEVIPEPRPPGLLLTGLGEKLQDVDFSQGRIWIDDKWHPQAQIALLGESDIYVR